MTSVEQVNDQLHNKGCQKNKELCLADNFYHVKTYPIKDAQGEKRKGEIDSLAKTKVDSACRYCIEPICLIIYHFMVEVASHVQ